MKRCPHCGSDLTSCTASRLSSPDGHHTATGAQLVTCPDCGGAIDGLVSRRA